MLYYMSVKINFSRLINNIYLFPIACFLGSWCCWGAHGECAGSCITTVSSFLMGHLSLVFVSVVCMYSLYWKYLFCYRASHWLTGIWCWKFHVHSSICISDLGEVALETEKFLPPLPPPPPPPPPWWLFL